jgi:copper chaperone CopZ
VVSAARDVIARRDKLFAPAVTRAAMITRLTIAGMTSPYAAQAVFTALTPVEGIVHADVRLGMVTIEHDGRATESALREAIATAGYTVVTVEHDRRSLPTL